MVVFTFLTFEFVKLISDLPTCRYNLYSTVCREVSEHDSRWGTDLENTVDKKENLIKCIDFRHRCQRHDAFDRLRSNAALILKKKKNVVMNRRSCNIRPTSFFLSFKLSPAA